MPLSNLEIVINILFQKKRNVFLSGIGGCGKSYLAKELRSYCIKNNINCVLTSTTGISAYNIGGQTIHSWSSIVFNKTSQDTIDRIVRKILKRSKDKKKIRNAELLIIDEISMLGGTYLEVMDYVFKEIRDCKEPLGGLRVLFTGDFLQLPPVNDVYAFQSIVWKELNLVVLELTVPKRFDDPEYAEMLLRIRRQEHTEYDFEKLEERYEAYKKLDKTNIDNFTVLMSKKKDVHDYNIKKLDSLEGVSDIIVSKDKVIYCDDTSLLSLLTINDYPEVEDSNEEDFDKYFMSPKYLKVKPMCRVMIVQNIDQEKGIVNGSQGTFIEFKPTTSSNDDNVMSIKLDNGIIFDLPKMLFYQQHGDEVFTRIQYPVILAYGLTIHKCQGLTLNNVIINVGKDIFEAGQAYVALSRCRNLKSLYLSGISDRKLYCDQVAKRFEDRTKKYSLH